MQRTDGASATFPMGIVPVGTANAMANDLDGGKSGNQLGLQSRAALAAAGGHTTRIDVVQVTPTEPPANAPPGTPPAEPLYGLSCFGWGLAGAVALKAAQLRWVPGQRAARYDIAGFVTLVAVRRSRYYYFKAAPHSLWRRTGPCAAPRRLAT